MGRQYSLNGYLNAVCLRSCPTLLVEGATDKEAVNRLLAERDVSDRRQCCVDDASLLEDTQVKGCGAKQKVLSVRREALTLSAKAAKLSTALGFLVDREWDGLPDNAVEQVHKWQEPTQSESSFVTIGHSIENYLFQVDCVIDYLRFAFSEHLSVGLENEVRTRFNCAIALAGAVSCEARARHCLSRLNGFWGPRHIRLSSSGRLYLADDAASEIESRCQIDAATFVAAINAGVDSHWAALSENPNSKWVLHGHVGAEVLWACIGRLSADAGVPKGASDGIASGFKVERRRCWFTWLARTSPELRLPLDHAVDWLLSTSRDS